MVYVQQNQQPQYQSYADSSIIVAGIVLAVWEMIMILCYFFLSTPFTLFLNAIFSMDINSYQVQFWASHMTALDMCFAGAMLFPLFWFLVWCISVESGSYRYKVGR